MNQYYLSPIAEQDIDEIVTYLAQENVDAAMKLLDSLYKSLDLLASNSMMGHKKD